MTIDANGVMFFDDIFELNYELLSELEYEVKPDGSVIDTVSNSIIFFNGLKVTASIKANDIHYPGQGEIAFDILNNTRLTTMLFGQYIQRKIDQGMSFVSWYPEERVVEGKKDKDPDIRFSNITVKFDNIHEVSSPFYMNKCLKFIYMIFYLDEGNVVNLNNFDAPPEIM